MFFVCILPLFILAMRYLTAPILPMYSSKLNPLLTPLAIIPFFFFNDYDILFMSIAVFLVNLVIVWRMLDRDEDSLWI